MPLKPEPVVNGLPFQLDIMRAEANAEGYRMLDRLATEWDAGATRFDRVGEALLAARMDGVLAGIGGLTHDPVAAGALRMRRFYVRPSFRRCGIGRMLAGALLRQPGCVGRAVTVNAGTVAAPAFWAALGFIPDLREGHTHVLRPSRATSGLPR